MAPRTVLFAACMLLFAAVASPVTPALGSSLLLGGSGFVLERPLLLQGVDVGATLSTVQQALSAMQAALQTAQEDIADLKLKNIQLQSDLDESKQEVRALQGTVGQLEATVLAQGDRLSQAETNITALEAARRVMNGTVTDQGARLAAAESNVVGLAARVLTAEADLTDLDTRLTAAETLGLPSTPLTVTLAAVRDLSSGTPLYTAIDNLRTLTPGTTLTDTLIQVRDLTSGTPLYTAVTDLNTRLTAAESLSGAPSSALYTAVTGLQSTVSGQGTRLTAAEGGLTDLTTRVAAAENLNGTATTLTTTVLALRDLTGGSTLVTTVTGLRDNSGSSALVTTLGSLRNKTDTGSALIRSLPCYGETSPSAWQVWEDVWNIVGIYVEVSMSACGFSAPPQHVSTSLFGDNSNWLTLGPSSVYSVTATSFRVYVLMTWVDASGNVATNPHTPAQVAAWNWRINWMAAR